MSFPGCNHWLEEIREGIREGFYHVFESDKLVLSLGKQTAIDLILTVCNNYSRRSEIKQSLTL